MANNIKATMGDIGLMSGGSSGASGSTGDSGGGNLGTNSLGTNLDLSNLQSIQGHTIYDGLDAQETAQLFNSILGNASNQISSNAASIWRSFINSDGLKYFMLGMGALIAYLIFFKKGKK